MSNQPDSKEERRQFFRLDVDIIFDYVLLDNKEKVSAFEKKSGALNSIHNLHRDLKNLDGSLAKSMPTLQMRQPEVADYVRLLNQKIDLFANFLTTEIMPHTVLKGEDNKLTRVNLSAGGLAFQEKNSLSIGTQMKIKIILMPSYESVVTKASVVSCLKVDEDSETPYRISIQFDDLSDSSEQILVKYMYHLQIAQRQAARDQKK